MCGVRLERGRDKYWAISRRGRRVMGGGGGGGNGLRGAGSEKLSQPHPADRVIG